MVIRRCTTTIPLHMPLFTTLFPRGIRSRSSYSFKDHKTNKLGDINIQNIALRLWTYCTCAIDIVSLLCAAYNIRTFRLRRLTWRIRLAPKPTTLYRGFHHAFAQKKDKSKSEHERFNHEGVLNTSISRDQEPFSIATGHIFTDNYWRNFSIPVPENFMRLICESEHLVPSALSYFLFFLQSDRSNLMLSSPPVLVLTSPWLTIFLSVRNIFGFALASTGSDKGWSNPFPPKNVPNFMIICPSIPLQHLRNIFNLWPLDCMYKQSRSDKGSEK